MKKTLVKAGWLVSMDKDTGTLESGEMLVIGNEIAAVGKNLGADADEVIDAPEMILMPGLVNAHMHTWQAGLRGVGASWPAGMYFKHVHGNMAMRYQPDDVYLGNLVGALNQIDNGVTSLFDWCHILRDLDMAERAVDGLEESGIRALFGHGTAKPPARPGEKHHTEIPHPRERLEALRKGRFSSDDGLLTLGMCMLGPEMSIPEVSLADYRLAKELDIVSSCHSSFPSEERVQVNGWPALAEAGLLGPRHNICHGNALSDEDLFFILEQGVTVTPTVMLELQAKSAPPLTVRIRDRGSMPSLGIDTEPLCSGDMFNELRVTWMHYRNYVTIERAEGRNQTTGLAISAEEVLSWATIGGARAMGIEDRTGSLSVGKRADFILLDASDLDLFPVYDPIDTIVGYASGKNVDTVFIDGVARKRDGKLLYAADLLKQKKTELAASTQRIIAESGLTVPIR